MVHILGHCITKLFLKYVFVYFRCEKELGAVDNAHEGMIWTTKWHPLGHVLVTGSNDHTRLVLLMLSTRCFQVIGIPIKGGQCLAVIYSNIVALNTRLFTRYVRRHPSKKIDTKKLPEKLFDAFENIS